MRHWAVACSVAIGSLAFIVGIGIESTIKKNETAVKRVLFDLANAEADYRSNRSTSNSFWTGDIGHLVDLGYLSGDIAFADRSPNAKKRSEVKPYHGYWITVSPIAIAVPISKDGVHPDEHSDCFAVTAYPARYGLTGRRTFYMDYNNTIWSFDVQGEPIFDVEREFDRLRERRTRR